METILSMLSISEFRVMSFERKCDIVTYHGQFLIDRVLGDCKVFLYHADDFYIEVFYSPKHQRVLMINAFDQPIGLEPYLDRISVADADRRSII